MALSLGRTVAELEATVSPQELHQWQEYYMLEPFSSDRNERLMVQLISMVGGFVGSKADYYDYFVSDIKKPKKKKIDFKSLANSIKNIFGKDN